MKLLLPHYHYDHHCKMAHHGKKGHKIMKKMAKLEKKLSKYNFASSDSDSSTSSDSTSRSRSHSRCRNKRRGRRHHKHGRHFGSHHRSSSSSDSSSSNSSSSSRSPSPPGHHRHHHHNGPPRHLSRSKSFAGRCSPPPFDRDHHPRGPQHHPHGPHHHPHPPHHRGGFWNYRHPLPPHHRGRFWNYHHSRRHGGGIQACLYRLLAQSEPNLQETSPERQDGEQPEVTVDDNAPIVMDEDIQEVGRDNAGWQNEAPEGPEIDGTLAEKWTETIQKGLPSGIKKKLLDKYPVCKNCLLLRGPIINKEILPVATEAAIKTDTLQFYDQNQIGTGLTALGQAISDLNNKPELKNNQEVVNILETLNEAALIILDAHHNITKTRQAMILPELKKGVRSVVETCKADEFLYGNDFGEKVKDIKAFKKGMKSWKGGKRKHNDYNEAGRKSKRLDGPKKQ